jgi:transposase, IS5 family
MAKIILFDFPCLLDKRFLSTDLGELYQSIPIKQMASTIPLPKQEKSGKGCKPWFNVEGGIGLLILKHHLKLSDADLIKRINTDWAMQQFCGIQLKPNEVIRDINLPSYWRSYIGKYLDIDKLQSITANYWKPNMNEVQISTEDATCYESNISFPTPVKIVWKSCNEVYSQLQDLRKFQKLRTSRCNYEKHKKAFLAYQKSRKKTKKAEKKLLKSLLKFLLRLIELHGTIIVKYGIKISNKKATLLNTIITVYEQQHSKVYGKVDKIKDRIVSLNKPYIRPIVRGKENKPVEFGAKVNKLMVDGISFIEHFSYDAFNEGTRLEECIYLHRKLFGKCSMHSADKIYATNANRRYCSKQNIKTNFVPKGKQKEAHKEQDKILRASLDKERGTRLEGSFGNEKNHYLLQKVNARNEITEKCWIFFGILTANANIITNRRKAKEKAVNKAA